MKRLEDTIELLTQQLKEQKEENRKLKEALFIKGLQKNYSDGERQGYIPNGGVSRSKLWSSISHEILTPMDAILGMTDLVMETDLSAEQRNYLEMINASADRLFGVVSDILDYSELIEGKLRCDALNFDLFEELQYDLYVAELSCKHKELKFFTNFSKNIPNYLNSDPNRLRQVLNNIISNAIKYTSQGEISVSIENGGYDDNGRLLLQFTVKDTGKGIAQEMQHGLFKQPVDIDLSEDAEKYSEGGLGLVVSAKLVELFGGNIGVYSKEGEGSTFWFSWPVVNPAEMYMGELPPDMFDEVQDRSMVLQGIDVLLAEDEFINASITKAFLEQAGINVTVVNSGKAAVEAVEEKKFQAILMDVQMPEMDGIEATMEIRKREKSKGLTCPIIALTAHAMHGDREKCLRAGMDDYITKPLDKDHMIEMLARYVTKKALIVGGDPVNQHDIIQPLVQRGWAVTITETGRMAKYEASLAHFDMIVIDASLPLVDGIDMVKTIRQLEIFSGCRATVVGVGISTESEVDDYRNSGVDECFPRPEVGSDFANTIEAIS